MKKTNGVHLSLGLVAVLLITSCSVEKRNYMSGYHINWNHSKQKADVEEIGIKNNSKKEILEEKTAIIEDSTNAHITLNSTASIDESPIVIPTHKPISFTKPAKPTALAPAYEIKKAIQKNWVNKKTVKKHAASVGKSQIVALILCLFLGLLGIHRFYLGYNGLGVLYLLTGALCGVGWIIDMILLIIPGGLTEKGGN